MQVPLGLCPLQDSPGSAASLSTNAYDYGNGGDGDVGGSFEGGDSRNSNDDDGHSKDEVKRNQRDLEIGGAAVRVIEVGDEGDKKGANASGAGAGAGADRAGNTRVVAHVHRGFWLAYAAVQEQLHLVLQQELRHRVS